MTPLCTLLKSGSDVLVQTFTVLVYRPSFLGYLQETEAAYREILEPRPPRPPGRPVTIKDFLNNVLPTLLEYVSCQQRLQMWFMHDATPAHFLRNVHEHLTLIFQDRWIDRGGPTPWPARSSNLNPLYFWLWPVSEQSPLTSICEVTESLLLSAAPAVNPQRLLDLGVTCVVNAASELPDTPLPHDRKVAYHKVGVEDKPAADLLSHMDFVADVIEE
ncbi:hypothetical protein ANN_01009 [Periplaneta americana]|uniref:Uncharacterized protein n=1 Tax=Periplaneta americana TaxID=6978 RepID=A0ABQ8TSD8_PERAM|nr:hypothetical protein ANN_01009 [Periplaneta americana]